MQGDGYFSLLHTNHFIPIIINSFFVACFLWASSNKYLNPKSFKADVPISKSLIPTLVVRVGMVS